MCLPPPLEQICSWLWVCFVCSCHTSDRSFHQLYCVRNILELLELLAESVVHACVLKHSINARSMKPQCMLARLPGLSWSACLPSYTCSTAAVRSAARDRQTHMSL